MMATHELSMSSQVKSTLYRNNGGKMTTTIEFFVQKDLGHSVIYLHHTPIPSWRVRGSSR
jgi:hypothetical protein